LPGTLTFEALTHWLCLFSESKPVCRTNVSLRGNAVDSSDHIEIQCSVRYSGIWTPVFTCASHLPGISTNETSSNHVQYRRVIAASDIAYSTELNCSMNFTLITDYQDTYSDIPTEPDKPVYDFVWKTSAIRVVNASSKYTEILGLCSNVLSYRTRCRAIARRTARCRCKFR